MVEWNFLALKRMNGWNGTRYLLEWGHSILNYIFRHWNQRPDSFPPYQTHYKCFVSRLKIVCSICGGFKGEVWLNTTLEIRLLVLGIRGFVCGVTCSRQLRSLYECGVLYVASDRNLNMWKSCSVLWQQQWRVVPLPCMHLTLSCVAGAQVVLSEEKKGFNRDSIVGQPTHLAF